MPLRWAWCLLCTERLLWGLPRAFFSAGWSVPTLSAYFHRRHPPAFWTSLWPFSALPVTCHSCTEGPASDAIIQVESQKDRVEGKNHLPQCAGHVSFLLYKAGRLVRSNLLLINPFWLFSFTFFFRSQKQFWTVLLPWDLTNDSIKADWPVMTTKTGMKSWKINHKDLSSLTETSWSSRRRKPCTFSALDRREKKEQESSYRSTVR